MTSQIFDTIGDAVTAFITMLGNGLQSIVALFWTAPTTEGGAGSFTFLGVLALIGAGVGLVYWIFYLIRGMLRINIK